MVFESASGRAFQEVLVGRDPAFARQFSVAAVITVGVFGVLFSLLAWNVFDESSALIVGFWIVLGSWTLLTPILNAYKNDGLLISWLLASAGPFAVGLVLALSPALTGSQRALVDVLAFALELSFEFGLPAGAIGYAIGSWTRIANDLHRDRSVADRVLHRWAILAGTAFLLAIPAVKLVWNAPKDVLASPLDVALLGVTIVGLIVGLVLLGLLYRQS